MTDTPELKPCPFCGEHLVKKYDHHGSWWGHRNEFGDCHSSIDQLHNQDDFDRWNRRTSPWQPIETAPKDGTRILGGSSGDPTIEVIFNAHGNGWFNQSAEISLWKAFPPTHWMPLPEPPEVEK